MIAALGRVLSRVAQRAVPDPFVLALGLTALVIGLGVARVAAVGSAPPGESPFWLVATGWAGSFSGTGLLAFALQMCLVLVTGHALALSPPVQRAVAALARLPRSSAGAAALVALVSALAAVGHWGLGAIVGAFVAREIGRHASARGLALHYPLLGAAAYCGLAVWHGGLSGSAPLKVAEPGHFAEGIAGVVPVSETLASPLNLVVTGALIALLPALFYLLTPGDESEFAPPDPNRLGPLPATTSRAVDSLPAWLQESPAVGRGAGALGLGYVVAAMASGRSALDINTVNMAFLFLGLACQGSVRRYGEAIADGAAGAGAIIVQFPFYFGILGAMKASGMIDGISQWFVDIASPTTFPTLAFLSAGIVNFLVPSGGGQWAVQGEILLGAGQALGVAPGTTIMAFSYGDAWTNMLQPFWALPLLGITGLKARDIIGYTGVVFIAMGILVPTLLLVLT